MNNMDKVPSVMSYTSSGRGNEPQWGADISDDALTVINQKLELELQDTTEDELDLLLYVLDGTRCLDFDYVRRSGSSPDFPCATPDQIVTEYLKRIFECTRGAIQIEQLRITGTPVDLVITMPVGWTYEARNSLFRAARVAGFSKDAIPTLRYTIMVSEPEAAAYYTAGENGAHSLAVGKCFVMCDAGGGTVDAVAYKVKQLQPLLLLERVTEPTGRKCGSSLIDTEFKRWLQKTIGVDNYKQLDPFSSRQQAITAHTAESGPIRRLVKSFYEVKSRFSRSNQKTIKIELPAPLNSLTIGDLVNEGELLIQWQEMKAIMDKCVNPTVKLILDQIGQVVTEQGTTVKTIFLVGGFGASPYLQEELKRSFRLKGVTLVHPERHSQTAVVQGAVVHGIQRPDGEETALMTEMTKTFGYVDSNNKFHWFTRRGDWMRHGKRIAWRSPKFSIAPPSGLLSSATLRLFRFDEDDGSTNQDLPDNWEASRNDVHVAGSIDAGKLQLRRGSELNAKRSDLTGPFRWHVVYEVQSQLFAELFLGEVLLGRCEHISMAKKTKPKYSGGPYGKDDV